ncbi:tripartite tricarboxylate transporter substrate binding protein [Diaphorobacter sp.]|uniref:Bug family tripartite tricarboxylate transporter substrate binding protein n=1 Tax=Diaphorobacter sp. TaxID=1934310 RepID=UPI0028B238EF|nr:tripartite tricarboxylate transporter substrate binding protein [Diaphorobacter sp.]
MHKRRLFLALGATLAIGTPLAKAQEFPVRPIKLIVPYAAGGPTDTFARALSDAWGKKLGTSMIVENRTGAGTLVGTEVAAKSAPDGYTILLTTVAHAVNPSIQAKLPYRTVEDFAPVGLAAKAPLVIVVNKNLPVKDLPAFLQYIKDNPGKVNYGSAGVGSAPHLGAELLNYMTDSKAVHVPYRGSAPSMQDVIAGHLAFMIDSAPTGLAQVKAGSVRLLGTTMEQRLAQTPDTPAVSEFVPQYEAYTWNAAFVPASTPAPIIAKLNSTLKAALADNHLQQQAYDMGLLLEKNPTPQGLSAFLQSELDKWSKVAKAAHMTAN